MCSTLSCLLPGEALLGVHLITTILMNKAKPEGGAKPLRESDEPIVAVKQPAEDLHGDMRRGENGMKAPGRRESAGKEAKGGTQERSGLTRSQRSRGWENQKTIRTGTRPYALGKDRRDSR